MAGDTRTERGDRGPTPDLSRIGDRIYHMWRVSNTLLEYTLVYILYGKHTKFYKTKLQI